jgi:hypothetical protein
MLKFTRTIWLCSLLALLTSLATSRCAAGQTPRDGVDFSVLPPTWPPARPGTSPPAPSAAQPTTEPSTPRIKWSATLTVETPNDLDGPTTIDLRTGKLIPPPPPGPDGIRVDLTRKQVEFDGQIIVNVHDPETPIVYIEALVCRPDSMEHESLVMTTIPARFIHAGLLAIGLDKGSPGSIIFDAPSGTIKERKPPTGDPVIIEIARRARDTNGKDEDLPDSAFRPITNYLTSKDPAKPLNLGTFVFAGSRTIDEQQPIDLKSIRAQAAPKPSEPYLADAIGSVIGLHTFGVEMIAPTTVLSPDSGADTPFIIADKSLPKIGTPVTIRIRPAKK